MLEELSEDDSALEIEMEEETELETLEELSTDDSELETKLETLEELSKEDSELEIEEEEATEDKDELEGLEPDPPPHAVSAKRIDNKLKRMKFNILKLLSIIGNLAWKPKARDET